MFVGLQNWEAPSMCLSTQACWNKKHRNSVFLGSPHMKALGNRITFQKTGWPVLSLCSHSKPKVLCAISEQLWDLRLWGASLLGWDAEEMRVLFHHPNGCLLPHWWPWAGFCAQKSFKVAWFESLKPISRSTVPIRIVRSFSLVPSSVVNWSVCRSEMGFLWVMTDSSVCGVFSHLSHGC